MASGTTVARLVDEIGASTDEAARIIDELGEQNVRKLLDSGDDTPLFGGPWRQTGVAITGLGGAGATGVKAAGALDNRYDAKQADDSASVVEQLMNSDLSAEEKARFMELYADGPPNSPSGGGGDDGDGIPFLDGLDDAKTMLVLLVVLAIVVMVATDGNPVPTPTVVTGGGGR